MTQTRQATAAIIGAGPAGIAAAIQCQRQEIPFVIFEKNRIGGLLHNANLVENYPGFPDGISGPDLIDKFQQQLFAVEIEVRKSKVGKIDFINDSFQFSAGNDFWQSSYLILATGTKPVASNTPLPAELADQVHYEIGESAR